jgi:hypothetical protein
MSSVMDVVSLRARAVPARARHLAAAAASRCRKLGNLGLARGGFSRLQWSRYVSIALRSAQRTMPSPRSSKRKNRRGSPTGEHIRLGGPQDDPLFEAAAAPATIRRYDVRSRSSPGSSTHPERVLVNARAPYAPVHPHPSHRRARRSSPKPPRFHRIARIAHERSSSLLLACTKGACRRAVRRGWSHEAKGLGLSCRAGSALAMPPQWALASIEPGWASRCRAVSIECWQTKPRTEEALWLPQLEEDSWLLKWRFASTSMRWLSPPSPARAEAGAVRGTAAMVLSPPLRAATPTRRGWTRPPAPE